MICSESAIERELAMVPYLDETGWRGIGEPSESRTGNDSSEPPRL